MAESPLSDTLDDLLFNEDENTHSDEDNDQSNESLAPMTSISSNNGLKIKIKKRKHEQSLDRKGNKKKKKSKSQPTYMRRNIRHLLTKDKLKGDTISALQAEQDRLKRLEDTTQQFQTIYSHLPTHFPQTSTLPKSNEHECIVLDDDEDDEQEEEEEEEEETATSLLKPKIDSGLYFFSFC